MCLVVHFFSLLSKSCVLRFERLFGGGLTFFPEVERHLLYTNNTIWIREARLITARDIVVNNRVCLPRWSSLSISVLWHAPFRDTFGPCPSRDTISDSKGRLTQLRDHGHRLGRFWTWFRSF
jgi:hypothetical protein